MGCLSRKTKLLVPAKSRAPSRLTMTCKSRYRDSTGVGVIAIYPYIETNPYQRLLSEALEKRGYRVRKLPRIDNTFPFQIFSQCRDVSVVHFHWIEHLYEARIRLFSPVRAAILLAILFALRSCGTRIVYTLHNLVPHNTRRLWYHLFVQKLIIKLAHATIVHSRPALHIASSTFGSSNKFRVISHGRYDGYYPNRVPKAEARSFLNIPNDAKVALFLGSMGGYKGARWLLQSAEELARRNIILLLAGDTSGLGEWERELLRKASQNNVILREGFVPESRMQYFLNSANCLVLPYMDSFTSGMAFLGLSFRLPIVGTSATAFKEIIDLKLCLPCDPNDPTSVAGTIERVCAWDQAQFEERCDDFLATCGWDEIADRHLALYDLCTHRREEGPQRIQPDRPSEANKI